MLPVSSSLKTSECSPSSCFLELDRRNGNMDSTLRLVPRKVNADTERTIVLAVIFSIVGSIAIVFLIYYTARYYLLRQNRLSSTDMIIEQPIEISSPQKRDFLSSPTVPPKPSRAAPRLPNTIETTPFILNHPYAQPYAVRDTTSMAMPQSTIGTSSNADSLSAGRVSVRSMPHPYSSRLRQDQHHPKSDTNTNTNTNSQAQTHATAPTTTTDESQQYESFMTPDTPRSLSFKELSLSVASPDTTESGLNPAAATTEAGAPPLPTERGERTGVPPAALTNAAPTTTTTPFKVTYPPSAYTHDTIHSEDTLPSMYSYTSTSGPIPIQELHFAQASPPLSRTQFR